MNWKQEAKEHLAAYESNRSALRNMELLVKEMEMDIYSPPSQKLDAPIRGRGADPEEFRLNRLVTLETLRSRIRQTKIWLAAVDGALRAMSQEERLILFRFFIRPEQGAAEQLCQELNLERTTVYRMRDKSLERFTLALYGIDQPLLRQ